jgi:hypothetical protein
MKAHLPEWEQRQLWESAFLFFKTRQATLLDLSWPPVGFLRSKNHLLFVGLASLGWREGNGAERPGSLPIDHQLERPPRSLFRRSPSIVFFSFGCLKQPLQAFSEAGSEFLMALDKLVGDFQETPQVIIGGTWRKRQPGLASLTAALPLKETTQYHLGPLLDNVYPQRTRPIHKWRARRFWRRVKRRSRLKISKLGLPWICRSESEPQTELAKNVSGACKFVQLFTTHRMG